MSASIHPIGGNGETPPPAPKAPRKTRRKQCLDATRRSHGSPYDDLTLVLGRAEYMAEQLMDELGTNKAIVPMSILLAEIKDALRIAEPMPDWYAE